MASRMRTTWYRIQARRRVHRDGELEIDDKALVSKNTAPRGSAGAYVQAWVWIEDPERHRRTRAAAVRTRREAGQRARLRADRERGSRR